MILINGDHQVDGTERETALRFLCPQQDPMDIPKLLKQLREELAILNEAIMNLEQLEAGRSNRRGRPPKWLKEARLAEKKTRNGKSADSQ